MNIDVQTLLIEMAKAKMSIKELSEKSEVCRGTIAAIKKGSEVKPETVGKIAEALGVSVEELLEERKEKAMESKYYKATDVMAMLECSETYAYKVIRQLNEELEADGYIVVRGKVPKQYLEKKLCLG